MNNIFQNQNESELKETPDISNAAQFLNTDFILLILIILIFFANNQIFSGQLQFLTSQFKQLKNFLDIADATVQALDQASQLPNQMLK